LTEKQPISVRSLDKAFARGVAWTAGSKWTSQIFTWASTVAVARLLSLEDYGIVGMAGVFLMLTRVVAEFGLGLTVLQMRELQGNVLRQLNTVAVLQGLGAFMVALLASPAVGWFYSDPNVPLVFCICALTFVASAFSAIPIALIRRKLDYRILALADISLAGVQAITTLSCALAGWGYWSLVTGYLTGSVSHLGVILVHSRLGFSWPRWAEIMPALKFGSKAFTSSIATTLYTNSARMVIGRQMGADLLGAYQMAGTLANAPVEKLASMVMRSTAPVFARSQSDISLMRRYFLNFSEVLSLVIVPLTIGASLVAEDLVVLAFGAKWLAAAEPTRWLCCFVLFRLLSSLMGQALYSLRESQLLVQRSLLALVVMPLAFFLASFHSLGAVAAAWGLSIPLVFVPSLLRLRKRMELRYRDFLNALWPSLCCGALMVATVLLTQAAIKDHIARPVARLLIVVPAGGIVYIGAMLLLFRSRLERYRRFWKNFRVADPVPGESNTI
jgi:teichuronic acid exporter